MSRLLVFTGMIIFVTMTCIFISGWNDPLNGFMAQFINLGLAAVCFFIAFAYCGGLANQVGIVPGEVGRRHYLCCFQLAYLLSLGAVVLLGVSHSLQNFQGSPITSTSKFGLSVLDLVQAQHMGMHFAARDGFLALNLSQSMTTLSKNIGDQGTNMLNIDYCAPEPEKCPSPTFDPLTTDFYSVSPIFEKYDPCLIYTKASAGCLAGHKVLGWSIQSTYVL